MYLDIIVIISQNIFLQVLLRNYQMFVSANADRYDKCCETQRMSIIVAPDKEVMHKITAQFYIPMIIKKWNTCVLFLESECVSTPNQSVII